MTKPVCLALGTLACAALAGCATEPEPFAAVPPAIAGPQVALLGSDFFDFRGDAETVDVGNRGARVSAIGVRPLESDAKCSKATAHFADGGSRQFVIGDYFTAGQAHWFALPGGERDVTGINMMCRPLDTPSVTMQVLAMR